MEPIITTQDLKKVYRLGKVSIAALRGVDMAIHEGEFIAVMGPSGCGKSTLLHVLGGLTAPTSGHVRVDGNDFSIMKDADRTRFRRHKIGFVFQRFNLLPTLTARQNIAIAQNIQGNGFNPHRFDAIVTMLSIQDKLDRRPYALSGGEQQRVAIARAVICEPEIVLADEPTGNLDTENSQTVLNMLRELNRSFRQTILMITHNPEAAAVADRILRMRDGRIIYD
ncbi:MAG: ABC transporter ATP-binding protein [Acidobacteria bacterium]|nr:MAG: ABC transporter ATP-binding protein [Acidobacteriota bacterium]PYV24394.1 MAG: ABC transporter ATP-binding protein [Acidobacteriota bacterium]